MSNTWPLAEEGEVQLPDPENATEELLWRQVPPHNWDETTRKPASQAFGPQTSDNGKPSFSRQSKVTAQAARDWHQDHANSPSRGVWAVTVAEVRAADSRAMDDSGVKHEDGASPRAPGHCYVDYRDLTRQQRKVIVSQLLMRALRREEISTEAKRFHKEAPELADEGSSSA